MSTSTVSKRGTANRRGANPSPTHANAEVRDEAGLGAIAMSIVHDLRNPLAAIYSAAEMLSGSQLPEHQVRRLSRNIYDASVRMQELLNDFFDLYRTRRSPLRPLNLRRLVAEAVDRIAAMAETQSVAVVQDIPKDLVVTLEPRRIGSVLANLLANALEAMPAGGAIYISAIAEENSVVIKVLDTGPGIAPEIRDCLFQPFVTAGKVNGWGLGLAQARQVVSDHGGEMWLESPPGWGACLAFSLPTSYCQ